MYRVLKKIQMKIKNLFYLLAIIFITSCGSDFIEADISKQNVNILTPSSGYASVVASVDFRWEAVKGALKYHLQVAKPSFASLQQISLDTMVTKTNFTFSFTSGQYEWKIRAMNGSSNTNYTYSKFSVDSGLDISKQGVTLKFPKNDSITNKLIQKFEWDPMPNALRYLLEIIQDGNVIDSKSNVTATTYTYTFTTSGSYQWRVLAMNDISPSLYSSSFNLTVDNTAPFVSTPTSPIAVDTASNPVSLKWTRDASAVGDSIYISLGDSLFANPVKKDFTTAVPSVYSYSGTIGKTYFWRLKSKDAAGNMSSGYSTTSKFSIIK